ncbi:MAG TPA: hypothetical protein VEY50_09295 [Lysobacter sp.]|nr:hypothetical protein [Lysobacter sp.]
MARTLALLAGDTIENIVLGEPEDFPHAVDVTDHDPAPGLGWTLVDDTFVPPEPVTPPQSVRRRWVTTRRFRERLSDEENDRSELFILRAMRPDATDTDMLIAAKLQRLNRMLSDGPYVDLDDPTTRAGVHALATIPGLLDHPERPAEILDGPIPDHQYHPDA